jgi:hypothetical protein
MKLFRYLLLFLSELKHFSKQVDLALTIEIWIGFLKFSFKKRW